MKKNKIIFYSLIGFLIAITPIIIDTIVNFDLYSKYGFSKSFFFFSPIHTFFTILITIFGVLWGPIYFWAKRKKYTIIKIILIVFLIGYCLYFIYLISLISFFAQFEAGLS